jgi:hypothetical protein
MAVKLSICPLRTAASYELRAYVSQLVAYSYFRAMNFNEFQESLSASELPPSSSLYLQALWYDGKGDWEKAHTIIQDIDDTTAAWIHAYLHRKEGDVGNAGYWYSRAGKKNPRIPLDEEWEKIVTALL